MDIPFPLAWTWTKTSPSTSSSSAAGQIIATLADALRSEGANVVVPQAESIEFECPGIAGMRRTALLAPISGGSLSLIAREGRIELTYRLKFVLLFCVSLAFGIVFGLMEIGRDPWIRGALVFSWLFLGNVVISLFRFSRFLHRTLADVSPPGSTVRRS